MIQVITTIPTEFNGQVSETVINISHGSSHRQLKLGDDESLSDLIAEAKEIEAKLTLSKRTFKLTKAAGYRIRSRDGKAMVEFYVRPGKGSNSNTKRTAFTVSPLGYRYDDAIAALIGTYECVYDNTDKYIEEIKENVLPQDDMLALLKKAAKYDGLEPVWFE